MTDASTEAAARPGGGPIPVTTAQTIVGLEIAEDLGMAFGLVVRSMGFARSVGAGLKSLRQGEVSQYTELLEDSRRHAIDRLVENARLMGANAVVAMRFDSSEIGQQLTEIVAYGTAVVTHPAAAR
ncbi:MAG: YbjQ family protein [Streptosporangiaceae bacterium]